MPKSVPKEGQPFGTLAWSLPDEPELVAAIEQAPADDLAQTLAQTGWRREVFNRGKYWGWRRGRGAKREFRPGGAFGTLDRERQEAYQINRAKAQQRATHGPAGDAAGGKGQTPDLARERTGDRAAVGG